MVSSQYSWGGKETDAMAGGSGGARGAWEDEASAFVTSQGNPKKEVDSSSLKELRADAIFTLWSLRGHRERFGWESGGCQREHVSGGGNGSPMQWIKHGREQIRSSWDGLRKLEKSGSSNRNAIVRVSWGSSLLSLSYPLMCPLPCSILGPCLPSLSILSTS